MAAEILKRLGVEQRRQSVHGPVCVADGQEHGCLAVAKALEIDLAGVGKQLLCPMEGKGGQLFCQKRLDAGIGPGGLLDVAEHLILRRREAVGGKGADLLEQPVKAAVPHLPQEPDHTAQMMLLAGKILQHIGNHG